jgi:leucyl-tRNA synthetase
VTKTEPKTLYIYVAAQELTKAFLKYVTYVEEGLTTKEAVKKIYEEIPKNLIESVPQLIKLAVAIEKNLIDEVKRIKDFDECQVYKKSKEYLEKETGMEIRIYYSNEKDKYDPKNKAKNALPLKPALFLE